MSDDLFRVQDISKRSLRLKKGKRHHWVEEGFVNPEINDEYVHQYGQTDGFLGMVLTNKRFTIALSAMFLLLGIILLRSAHLQIVQGATHLEEANDNRLRTINVRADRGLIYDRYYLPLVRNIPEYAVTVQPKYLPEDARERTDLLRELYGEFLIEYVDRPFNEFKTRINDLRDDVYRADKDLVVAEGLKQDHAILLDIWATEIPAIRIDQQSRRKYLNEGPLTRDEDDTTVYPPVKSLSHILGYQSPLREGEYEGRKDEGYLFNDVAGRTGLEYSYEDELRGRFGYKSLEVNAKGERKQVLSQQVPKDGKHLLTTIDVEFQRAVERILREQLEKSDQKKGAVVVLNPNNGDVLAMVSLPTFDNNAFAGGVSQETYQGLTENPNRPLFQRAISGEYPSGSTFKPIVAGAALQEDLVTRNTSFLSTGGIRINKWFFPDWRAGGHGQTNVYHAIADSVNTYFYTIGGGHGNFDGLGVQRITSYAERFGLSKPMNIDLPGEKSGFLPSKAWKESIKEENWYIGDTYHLAIGQGDLLVTPLQVAGFYAAFANGGTLYQPRVVSAYLDQNQQIIEEKAPHILKQDMISDKNFNILQTALRRVITRGSGQRLSQLSVDVSGKTGTAQWHSERDPHAWFAGYAPSENARIAFSILIEEGGDGSATAVPVANALLQWWAQHRGGE